MAEGGPNGALFDELPIAPSRRLLAGAVLALSNFMVVLDLTIANVSVPHIAGNLGITPDQGTWIITSYAVAEAISVPLTGWLTLRFGAVRVFITCMIGFALLSLLCGLSPTLGMLVVCRVGQGLCGGPMMPISQVLLMRIFPSAQRAKVMGLWAMTTILGPAIGPIVGGYISDNWSWHWIFFINLPVAALCTFAALAILRPAETETERQPIDKIGLLLLIFWIGTLQIMLDIGRDHDWFSDPTIVILAVLAAIGFAAFVIWELTEEHPIVDLRIFRHRGFTAGVITLALCFGAYFASIVIIPQWLQTSMGYTATWAGFATAATGFAAVSTAALAARLVGKGIDARILVSCGISWMGVMALSRGLFWTTGSDFWTITLPQLVQGFAIPFFFIPLTTITLGAVEPSETTSAAGLQNFLRTMAIAFSTSAVLTHWSNLQRTAQNEIVSKLQPVETQNLLSGMGMPMEQGRQIIANIVNQEATALAVSNLFTLLAVILFATAAFVWLTPRVNRPVDMSASH